MRRSSASDRDTALIPPDVFIEVQPPTVLRDRLLSLWVHRTGLATTRRIVPDGSAHIVCRIGAPVEIRRLETPRVEGLSANELVVGARLRPDVHCDHVASRLLDDLAAELALSTSPRSAVHRLTRWLVDRPLVAPDGDTLVARSVDALLADPRTTVDQLVARSSLSTRQWRRRFVTATGVGPKTLQRHLRFQLLLARIQAAQCRDPDDTTLAQLAIQAGYWDQAHLGNECRRLTGQPLGTFVHETTACCRHHDHAAAFANFTA